jgi:hypothetical protein
MSESRQQRRSHLFTVRLWAEDIGEDQAEWRGKVQHVISGDTRYFRDWNNLIALLQMMVSQRESGQPGAAALDDGE